MAEKETAGEGEAPVQEGEQGASNRHSAPHHAVCFAVLSARYLTQYAFVRPRGRCAGEEEEAKPPQKPLPTEKLQLRVRITGEHARRDILGSAMGASHSQESL